MILVVDMNWKPKSLGCCEFVMPILAVSEKLGECKVKHYLEVSKRDLCRCDKVILSGTALRDNEFLSSSERFQWLKEIEKPVLGICAGMEIIGVVFEARLNQSLEIGMTAITCVKDNPLFTGDFRAYSLHSVFVEASDRFEVLAQSTKCIQALKHKTKPIYGVLFHPEVRNQEIIKKFIEKIN
jgi:GMP synthase-like glutamine amidotransferase